MNEFFQYEVDGDTARNCLALVARAADRVARGESAFLGVKVSHTTKRREGLRRRSTKWKRYTPAMRAEAMRLRGEGLLRKEIAERMGLEIHQVDVMLYAMSRAAAQERLAQRQLARAGGAA